MLTPYFKARKSMCQRKWRKFVTKMVGIMTMKTRRWRMLKAMEIDQSNTAAGVVALAQMPLGETSERRARAQEKEEQMADERR